MATNALTIEQYELLPDTGVRSELVDGEVVESVPGSFLHNYVRDEVRGCQRSQADGWSSAEVEFRTLPDTVRRADVVWFRSLAWERWREHILRRAIRPPKSVPRFTNTWRPEYRLYGWFTLSSARPTSGIPAAHRTWA